MTFFQTNSLDVSRWSHQVHVPDNSIARLMYYLDIVCTLIEDDDKDFERLRNFRNYNDLTDLELRLLFITCVALDPDLFIGKVMFKDEDGDLCGTSSNRIFELAQVRHNFIVANSIVVAGRNRRVKKVMAYRPEWLVDNYNRPIAQLTTIFQRERQQKAINELFNTCTIS